MFVPSGTNPYLSQAASTRHSRRAPRGGAPLPQVQEASVQTQGFMRDIQKVLVHLEESIGWVKDAPVFVGPQSTNTQSVELSYTGSVYDCFEPIEMNVARVARTRERQSFFYDRGGSVFAAGDQTFAMEVEGGESCEFTITVEAGESNESVQKKMADAVNHSGLDLKAQLLYYTDRDNIAYAALSIESRGMGDDAARFSVRDVGNSSLVHMSGIDRLANEAQNAEYTLNGVAYTAASNEVDLGKGIAVRLCGVSNQTFLIHDGFSEIHAKNALSILYAPLNDLQAIARELKQNKGADALARQAAYFFQRAGALLSPFGAEVNSAGLLVINPAEADAALADGSLRSFLEDYYKNGNEFIEELEIFVSSALKNPEALLEGSLSLREGATDQTGIGSSVWVNQKV